MLGTPLGYPVKEVAERFGSYRHKTRTIQLLPELEPLQRRYVLAQEAGHAYHELASPRPRWEWEALVSSRPPLS